MKLLTAVLTSDSIQHCKRALRSIGSTDDVVIICNTLNDAYYTELCNDTYTNSFEIVRTESNGTMAFGKQSVVDYFRSTNYDWVVIIDGDDFLGPNGIQLIKDCLTCLNWAVDVLWATETVVFPNFDNFLSDKTVHCVNWNIVTPELFVLGNSNKNEILRKQKKSALKFYRKVKRVFGQQGYNWFRTLCFSQRAAEHVRFDYDTGHEEFNVGMNLLQKVAHNELFGFVLMDDTVYIYDQFNDENTGGGIQATFNRFDSFDQLADATFSGIIDEQLIEEYTIHEVDLGNTIDEKLIEYVEKNIIHEH
jgi:hypothetical protein